MQNPLLLDIALYLVSKGIVQEDGVDVFRDYLPEYPDSLVALLEYRGDAAVYYDENVNRSVQILVRDRNPDIARAKALDIYKSLMSDTTVINFTANRWGQVYLRQTPFSIGVDENDRFKYVFNIGVTTTIY